MTAVTPPVTRSHGREAARALAAELSKLVSLPATWLTLGGTLAANPILAIAFTNAARHGPTGPRSAPDVGLTSIAYVQAGFVVLGVLAACSEYEGGQIRTTLTAMPRRSLQFAAKHLAVAIVALPAAAITAASGVVLAAGALGGTAAPTTAGHVVRTLSGAAAYLALWTLIGVAVGALVRQTLPAVVAVLGYLFIAGPLLRAQASAARYLPDSAGSAMWSSVDGGAVAPARGALLVSAWTIGLIAVALLGYRRRDN
ncbi:hypothetical protein JOL79_21560 [Microbispora sp. RL4-1S]|uniref:ABC transporter permease n=1 Tax=Microbispora oryzae TaxID=2806554 RepID=A0A940WST4_9ACTN|nr:hypothetical protein [Microbispora oryzae]MBP2706401.1 hypothetical protein [Microbispora oryzae]